MSPRIVYVVVPRFFRDASPCEVEYAYCRGLEDGRDERTVHFRRGALADDLVQQEVVQLAEDKEHHREHEVPHRADLVEHAEYDVQHDKEVDDRSGARPDGREHEERYAM